LLSLLSPLQWDGEENQKEKAKLVGWDKNSLTEQQREKKIIPVKRIYSLQCFHCPMLSLFPSSKIPFLQPAPCLNTAHDIAWSRISHLISCLGQPKQLVVKMNPIPAAPRTSS